MKYLGVIKSGIVDNKNKIPNLSEAQNLINTEEAEDLDQTFGLLEGEL